MNTSLGKRDERPNPFDYLIEVILILMIVLSPLALGAVSAWARYALFILSSSLFGAWLLSSAWAGNIRLVPTGVWPFVLAFFLLALLQLVPLPLEVLKRVSPGAYETYSIAFSSAGDLCDHAFPISLSPYHTKSGLVRCITFYFVFFGVVNAVRHRWQALGVIGALLFVGVLEVLYGFKEMLSGEPHIFWLPRQYNLEAVTGTFHNKNHLAGLLEMIFPVALGLLFAMGTGIASRSEERQRRLQPWRRWMSEGLSRFGTYAWLLVAGVCVVLAVGILFSLSRAGILSAVISILCFLAFAGKRAGFRTHTIILLMIIIGIFSIASSIGVEMVVDVTKEAVTGQSTSWYDRFDLTRSGLALLKEFFWLGSGLGTFGIVFPRFQSARFGDRWADFLHNDWLQLFCEVGFVGGVIVLIGVVRVLCRLIREASSVRTPLFRWIGVGCLIGAVAVLLHSFFDYNLGKINSNALVFSVLLAICFVFFHMEDCGSAGVNDAQRTSTELQVGLLARVSIGVMGLAVIAAASWLASSRIVADIHFNRHLLAGSKDRRADDYFFLPVRAVPGDRGDGVKKAIEAEPGNSAYWYGEGEYLLENAVEQIRDRGEREAKRALQQAGGLKDQEQEGAPDEVIEAFAKDVGVRIRGAMRPLLLAAAVALREAIRLSPSVPEYHVLLADVLFRVGEDGGEALREAERAVWLAPNKPRVLFVAGKVFLLHGVSDGSLCAGEVKCLERAYSCFRRALYGDPAYAERVYSLLVGVQGIKADLVAVTPETTRAQEALARWLEGKWDWGNLLLCVERMEALVKTNWESGANGFERTEWGAPAGWYGEARLPPSKGSRSYDGRDPGDVLLSILGRRCLALGALNEWDRRAAEVARYRAIIRERANSTLAEAELLQENGRLREAIGLFSVVLQQDWANPRALLGAAETFRMSHGGVYDMVEETSPLEYLYRLMIYGERLDKQIVLRAMRCADAVMANSQSEEVLKDFVRAGLSLQLEEYGSAIETLSRLAGKENDIVEGWRQYHLIWYLLGNAYEAVGDHKRARLCYRRVLDIVPTHRGALIRLNDLGLEGDEGASSLLQKVTPAVSCQVSYGGKVVFLGYTLKGVSKVAEGEQGSVEAGGQFEITYYWEFQDAFDTSYRPAVHFCDGGGRILFQDDHRITGAAGPYPVDSPRIGEVVVESRRLSRSPAEAEYMRVGLFRQNAHKQPAGWMLDDSGRPWVLVSLTAKGYMQ